MKELKKMNAYNNVAHSSCFISMSVSLIFPFGQLSCCLKVVVVKVCKQQLALKISIA